MLINERLKRNANLLQNVLSGFVGLIFVSSNICDLLRLRGDWNIFFAGVIFLAFLGGHYLFKVLLQKNFNQDRAKKIMSMMYSLIIGLMVMAYGLSVVYFEIYAPHRDGPSPTFIQGGTLVAIFGVAIAAQQKWALLLLKMGLSVLFIVYVLAEYVFRF